MLNGSNEDAYQLISQWTVRTDVMGHHLHTQEARAKGTHGVKTMSNLDHHNIAIRDTRPPLKLRRRSKRRRAAVASSSVYC